MAQQVRGQIERHWIILRKINSRECGICKKIVLANANGSEKTYFIIVDKIQIKIFDYKVSRIKIWNN